MAALDLSNKKNFEIYFRQSLPASPGRRRRLIIGLGLVLAVLILPSALLGGAKLNIPQVSQANVGERENIIANYNLAKTELETKRQGLVQVYLQAKQEKERQEVLKQAAVLLKTYLEERLIPAWLGTPYDFNGCAQVPQTGSIACGVFITTVLKDAGFNIERIALGIRPAEEIIKNLVEENYIYRFSYKTGGEFLGLLRSYPQGIYLVGLDTHIGFLINDEEGCFFIHSSRLSSLGVVREEASKAYSLTNSSYRVMGLLNESPQLLRKWLLGERIP